MLKLQGKDVYLATLERADCKKIWNDFEYDFEKPSEPLNIGHSEEKSDKWFDDIQKEQGNTAVRLGIFLNDGEVIGDIALQDIDRNNRKCSIGMGVAKIENRSKGYGKQAVKLMLDYGFNYLGMERISANTLEINIPAQKSLEKLGFQLEGIERGSVYMKGKRYSKMNYAILVEEFAAKKI
jgi:RimJ/RimL family protein N-acetyltransferase